MMFLLLLLLLTFQKIFFFNRCCCCCFCSPTATALLYCPTPGSRYQDLKIKQEDSWCVLTGTDRPFLHTLLLLCYVERRRRGGRENPSPLLGSPNEAELCNRREKRLRARTLVSASKLQRKTLRIVDIKSESNASRASDENACCDVCICQNPLFFSFQDGAAIGSFCPAFVQQQQQPRSFSSSSYFFWIIIIIIIIIIIATPGFVRLQQLCVQGGCVQ